MKLHLAWKIVVGTPENGVSYNQTTPHFNLKSNNGYKNKIGGMTILGFHPNTFSPTHVFYNAVRPCQAKNGFSGKRIPFEGLIAGVKAETKIKIHQFSADLVILSVSVSSIEFVGDVKDLEKIINFENHKKLSNLIKAICSIISTGGKSTEPVQRKLKAYPYIEIQHVSNDSILSDKDAVHLLTRHTNPKPTMIVNVISKNDDHQVDGNSILIDRQGIFARYNMGDFECSKIRRKFESSHYLFELAIAINHMLESGQYLSLDSSQKNFIDKLIEKPDLIFLKSVTALKTWELLLKEFKLSGLHEDISNKNRQEADVTALSEERAEWSEPKKLGMGILSALFIGGVMWVCSTLYEKSGLFSPDPVKLIKPVDEAMYTGAKPELIFDWKDVDTVSKYIVIIEKFNSKDDKWGSLASEGRYTATKSNKSLKINTYGYFRWKVLARNADDEKISESVWSFFTLEELKGVESNLN